MNTHCPRLFYHCTVSSRMVKSIHMIPRFFCFVNVQFRRRYCSVSNDDTVQSETAEVFILAAVFSLMISVYHFSLKKSALPLKTKEKRGVNLTEYSSVSRFYRFRLVDFQPFKKPSCLLLCQFSRFCLIPGPLKRSVVKPFIQQQKSVSFPQQSLYPVTPSSVEQKQSPADRIKVQSALYYHSTLIW